MLGLSPRHKLPCLVLCSPRHVCSLHALPTYLTCLLLPTKMSLRKDIVSVSHRRRFLAFVICVTLFLFFGIHNLTGLILDPIGFVRDEAVQPPPASRLSPREQAANSTLGVCKIQKHLHMYHPQEKPKLANTTDPSSNKYWPSRPRPAGGPAASRPPRT